jgi:hypothetical protein
MQRSIPQRAKASIPSLKHLKPAASSTRNVNHKMPFLRYVYTKKINNDQECVQQEGYPYVNTVDLYPQARKHFIASLSTDTNTNVSHRYEKLMPHAHNSSNTHFIVEREMTMFYTKEADMKEGPVLGTYNTGDFVEIKAKKCYRAEAGVKGCTFVEGHKDLSPTSAKRFERMGMLTKTPTGGMKDTGEVMINCTHERCHWSDNSL